MSYKRVVISPWIPSSDCWSTDCRGLITIIIGFIFMLLNIIGSVRFARTQSMKEAFAFGEIFSTIGKIGWLNYIFS